MFDDHQRICKIDSQFKGRIKSALRKLTHSWKPKQEVRAEAKRAPATFECAECNYWCYEGSSKANLDKLIQDNPEAPIKQSKTKDDHIDPIVSVETGFVDWNTYIDRMFCPKENWQVLCKECHDIKTKEESALRKKYRHERKKAKS